MLNYIAKRLLAIIPVVAVVCVIIFLILHLTAGDPAAVIAGEAATVEEVEAIRQRLGLGRPLPVQFAAYVGQLITGDLGESLFFKRSVGELILQRVEPTVLIALLTTLIAVVIGVPLGIAAAWWADTWVDTAIMAAAILTFSLPVFLIGYLLMFGFAVNLEWLPVQGYRSITEGPIPFLRHAILPSVALALVFVALLARMTRATVVEVLQEDYVRTARAKGLRTGRVLFVHALKNAAIPIVTTIGLAIAGLLSGVVVTETVFSIPGLGRLTVDAVMRKDYPVVQGVVLVFSIGYVVINLLIDLSYTLLDPRVRY